MRVACSFILPVALCSSLAGGLSHTRAMAGDLPVPSPDVQARTLALAKEVFGQEFEESDSPEEKRSLAIKVLERASELKADPASYYVLLKLARDVAILGGDPATAIKAIDALDQTYKIDSYALRISSVLDSAPYARSREESTSLVEVAIQVMQLAIQMDDFESANQLADIAKTAARRTRDGDLARTVLHSTQKMHDIQEAFNEIRPAIAVLGSMPADPQANFSIGRYLCLFKQNWPQGIRMLSLGSEPALKSIAQAELKSPLTPDEKKVIGDSWWNMAQTVTGLPKENCLLRARHWYSDALPGLSGLSREAVSRRIAPPSEATPPTGSIQPEPKTLSIGSEAAEILRQDCLLLMTFEKDTFTSDGQTPVVLDLSGSSNHGILEGPTFMSQGKAGGCLYLDGKDDSIKVPALRDALAKDRRGFGLSVWILNRCVKDDAFVFDVGFHGTNNVAVTGGNAVGFNLPGSGIFSRPLPTNQWHHVVCSWDGSSQRIYIDCRLEAEGRLDQVVLDERTLARDLARIGTTAKSAYRSERCFQGCVDELAIFGRGLSEAEVRTFFDRGRRGDPLAQSRRR